MEVFMRHCFECGMKIPQGRLDIFPNTFYCAKHSTTQKYQGLSVYDHKTAGRIELFDPNNPNEKEIIRQAGRFNARSR
jgi:hypothetical protein